MKVKTLPLILGICTYVYSFLASLTDGSQQEMKELTPKSIYDYIKGKEDLFVEFYVSWCSGCKSFRPIFESLPSSFPHFSFARLNSSDDRSASARFVGDSFPSVAHFSDSRYMGMFEGEVNEKEIKNWVAQNGGDPVDRQENSLSIAQAAGFPVIIAGSFARSRPSPFSSEAFEWFHKLAKANKGWGRYIAQERGEEVGEKKDTIYIYHSTESHPREHIITGYNEMVSWVSSNRLPLFGKLTRANQKEYYGEGKNPVMFVGSNEDYQQHQQTFRRIAEKRRKDISVMWISTESPLMASTLSSLKVTTTPSFVVFTGTGSHRDHQRYVYDGVKDFNDETIVEEFIDKCFAGKVNPRVRSKAAPSPEDLAASSIKEVVGENFIEVVFNPSKDVFLILTYPPGTSMFPGCETCIAVVEMVTVLAKFLEEKKAPVIFGEFVVTANEIPAVGFGGNWTLDDLPVIYLVKAGTKLPVEYPGKLLEATALVDFWKANSELKEVKQLAIPLGKMGKVALKEDKKGGGKEEEKGKKEGENKEAKKVKGGKGKDEL